MKRYKAHLVVDYDYDEDMVYRLLSEGKDINALDEYGELIMVNVAETVHKPRVVKIILRCGADVYKRNKDGRNAVEAVFQNGHAKVLKTLLRNVPLSRDLQQRYRVCTATKKFPKNRIPRIFGTFEDGSNLLMNAIQFNRPLAVVRQLLKTGLYKLDARDSSGWTALRYAQNNFKLAKYLVKSGADVNDKDDTNDMYIDEISVCKNPADMILWALKNGANENTKKRMWDNLIKRPFAHKSVPVKALKALLNAGVDVNRLSEHPFMSQDTMLNETVKYGSVRTIKYLLGHGASPNIIDGNGETALICCAYEWKSRCRRVAKLLIKAGADPYFVPAGYKHSFMDMIKDEPYRDEIVAFYKKRISLMR